MELILCEVADGEYGLRSLSPFCEKAHRALYFHGLEYTRKHGGRPSHHKQYNPSGQVPVLLIDGQPVPDSTAILIKLEELSDKTLLPATPAECGEAWAWEEFGDSVIGQYIPVARWLDERHWPLNKHYYSAGAPKLLKGFIENLVRKNVGKAYAKRDVLKQGMDAAWKEFERHLDNLEARAPATGFWMGDALTVADIGLFSCIQELRIPTTPWHRDRINEHATLAGWLDRVDAATADKY
ncbi:MAG: glutathione S-transferase family protein [Gammaproteobacteria bacterium]|jgi:glutathione S-transferase|nr:glutathione S-transferase family protein [Gammaproteobacteria bacterium]MDP6617457.1 glutathione S-transferase family protein [Gammaproteobacteria bacterium]MDP6695751.1 glutathione S-transferase family protein [Gammaproteobacteria bacterium]